MLGVECSLFWSAGPSGAEGCGFDPRLAYQLSALGFIGSGRQLPSSERISVSMSASSLHRSV